MLRDKSQNNLVKTLIAALLAIFVAGQFLALSHSFSHQESLVKTSQELPHQDHKASDCILCSFASSINNIAIFTLVTFSAISFYLAFARRKFSRVKLSYLLTSNLSRAPPAIS